MDDVQTKKNEVKSTARPRVRAHIHTHTLRNFNDSRVCILFLVQMFVTVYEEKNSNKDNS